MEKPPKPALSKKRKRKSNTKLATSQPKSIKVEDQVTINNNESDTDNTELQKPAVPKSNNVVLEKTPAKVVKGLNKPLTDEEIKKKYPVLNNKELVEKFLKVPFTNNQKGRIRQAINLQLKNTTNDLIPDVIHSKLQAMLKGSENMTESNLRRIRILYNMLRTSVSAPKPENPSTKPKKENNKKKKTKSVEKEAAAVTEKEDKKEQVVNKEKGPKRYVVFIGNLPLDIDREKLMGHFSEMNEFIKDVRIPEPAEGKKSAIAYLELTNEPSYEMALSKHHSMLENKRIKVLYSMQKNTKMTKAEAKSKSAKLIALQKSGKLLGSVPLEKKRSHRRMKMKKARAKAGAE